MSVSLETSCLKNDYLKYTLILFIFRVYELMLRKRAISLINFSPKPFDNGTYV